MISLDLDYDENFEIIIYDEPLSPQSKISELKLYKSNEKIPINIRILDNDYNDDICIEFNKNENIEFIKLYLESKFNIIIKKIILNEKKLNNSDILSKFDINKDNDNDNDNIFFIELENDNNRNYTENNSGTIIDFLNEISNTLNYNNLDINDSSFRDELFNRINNNYNINFDENDSFLLFDLLTNSSDNTKKIISKENLDKFKLDIYNDIDKKNCIFSDQCSICYSNFNKNDFVRVLDCKHIYHKHCIDQWLLKYENTCPICKKNL